MSIADLKSGLAELVQQMLDPHNLCMEEVGPRDLTVVQEGLEQSTRLVRAAIDALRAGQIE
jgi:hypothetical protein